MWIYRFSLVGILVIGLFFIFHFVNFFDSKDLETYLEDLESKDGLRVFVFGSASAFALYGFKRLIFDKLDEVIGYLSLNDIEESDFQEQVGFEDSEQNKGKFNDYLKNRLKWGIPISVFFYFMIISFSGLVAYHTWGSKNENNNLYAFNISSRQIMTKDIGQFKLIFSFGHNDSILNPTNSTDELNTLRNLMHSFKGCLQDSSDIVLLKVRGFASENHASLSDRSRDITLANNRAKNIQDNITFLIEELRSNYPHVNKIKTEVINWKSGDYEKMIAARIFKEVNTNTITNDKERQNESAEYLNRRVEISIAKAGACE